MRLCVSRDGMSAMETDGKLGMVHVDAVAPITIAMLKGLSLESCESVVGLRACLLLLVSCSVACVSVCKEKMRGYLLPLVVRSCVVAR